MNKSSFFLSNLFKSTFNSQQGQRRLALSLGAVLSGVLLQKYKLDSKQEGFQQTLYAWGYGNFGQLGLGSEINKYVPEEIVQINNQRIKQIAAKKSVSAVLTENGQVYTFGKNKSKILGTESINTNVSLPTQVPGLQNLNVKFLTTGPLHMLAITDEGKVYTWGNASHGKLGHSFSQEKLVPNKKQINTRRYLDQGSTPQEVEGLPANTKIIWACCGNQHTVLLSDKGEVYTLGQNRKGVLGLDTNEDDVVKPTKVDFFDGKNIIQVRSGFDFNVALSADGKVYSWGNNDFGQLGNGSNIMTNQPQQLYFGNQKIRQLSCGDYFVGAVTTQGEVFTWGYGNDGQLCHKSRENIYSPQNIQFQESVRQISCGSGHVAVITQDKNDLYMFGRGREGQLGLGDTISSEATYRTEPKQVVFFNKKQKVVKVKCGGDHTLAVIEEKI